MCTIRSLRMALAAALVAHLCAGCTDVGDSTDVPGRDAAASDSTTDDGVDAGPPPDAPHDASIGEPVDAEAAADSPAGIEDVVSEPSDGDAAAEAASHEDADLDAASEDALDAGSDSPPDAPADSADGGALDATVDSGGADASDGGTADSGAADAGSDTGSDAAADVVEAGGALAPCTAAMPTGCVQCQGNAFPPNATTACTPTEAALVQHDIDRGLATAPGPDPAGACYTCLEQGGCLDDNQFSDTGHECEDFTDPASRSECEAVLACILGSSCASSAVSACYCGTAGVSSACQGNPAPGPINGKCASTIAAGLGFSVSDGTDVTKNLTDVAKPAGMADQIFQCAQSNGCTACLQ
jgi:hypothetical protein